MRPENATNCAHELCGVTSEVPGRKMRPENATNCAYELCGSTSEVPGKKMRPENATNCAHELCGSTSATSWALIRLRARLSLAGAPRELPERQRAPESSRELQKVPESPQRVKIFKFRCFFKQKRYIGTRNLKTCHWSLIISMVLQNHP